MTRIALIALLLPGVAWAQVNVNRAALDRLEPNARTAPAKPAARRPAHPTPAHPAPSPRASKLRLGLPPAVPPAAPATVVLPPAVTAPPRVTPPPPPVPVIPSAPGAVSEIKGGIRLTFGGGADLNPATEAAIRNFARSVKADATADLNLYAFAAGVPDDPSTPRRLSLARALAVRAILISEGIVSTRIYPRALGASPSPMGGEGPADRVDLVLANTPAATP